MRLRPLIGLGAAGVVGLICAPMATADSGTTVVSAWWNEAAVGPLAAPSTTPADQLQVSYGGSGFEQYKGPLAFAAVRVGLPGGTPSDDTVVLQLAVAAGSTVGTPAVSACPTTGTWKPGPNQAPESAPGYDCTGSHRADGTISGTNETWSIPASWASAGSISVALVPTAGTTAPFSVAYVAPSASSVTFQAPPAAAAGSGSGPVVTASPATGTGTGSVPSPAGGGSSTGGTAAVAGAAVGATVAPSAGVAPSLGGLPAVPTPAPSGSGSGSTGAGSANQGAPAAAAPGGGTLAAVTPSRVPHLVAFVLLLFVAVAVFGLAGFPERAPRLLGPLGDRLAPAARQPEDVAAAAVSAARPMGGGARIRAYRAARQAARSGYLPASVPDATIPGAAVSDAAVPGAAIPGAAFAEGPVRGIGRFARVRTGPPRRI